MEKYELNYDNDAEILKCIQDVILERHPIVEDRLDILYPSFNEPRTPEMEIQFIPNRIDNKDITEIIFLDGTSNYKQSIPNKIVINGLISKKVICDLISYLLADHDIFKDIYIHETSILLPMTVDGRNENMHGISCGEITLNFDFTYHHDNKLLCKECLKVISTTFYNKLKGTDTFKREFTNYCDNMKLDFLKSLTFEELKKFIDLLDYDNLYNLIYSMPNDCFVQLYNEYNNQENPKNLIKYVKPSK